MIYIIICKNDQAYLILCCSDSSFIPTEFLAYQNDSVNIMKACGFPVHRCNAKSISFFFCVSQLLEAGMLELLTTVGFQIATVVCICREKLRFPVENVQLLCRTLE